MALTGDQEEISSRLKLVRADLGETQKGMDDRLSLGTGGWKEFEASGRLPKLPQLQQLQQLGYSLQWLMVGLGEMKGDDRVAGAAAAALAMSPTMRLQAVRRALDETPAGMDNRLFLRRGSWATAEMTGKPPRDRNAISALERLGVSYGWLSTEQGMMWTKEPPTSSASPPAPTPPFELPERFAPGSDLQPAHGVKMPELGEMPRDLPLVGNLQGGPDGRVNYFESPLDYVRRPPGLIGRSEAYAAGVDGDSMVPRYEPGDMLYLDPRAPITPGDYVAIFVRESEHEESRTLVKRLVSRSERVVVVEQFNPAAIREYPRHQVEGLHKVLSPKEVLGL